MGQVSGPFPSSNTMKIALRPSSHTGLPVIASKFLRCRDVLERYECGILVDPRDSAEIAEAIRTVLLYPLQAQQMGERARLAVRDRFEWKSEAKSLVGLYEAVL